MHETLSYGSVVADGGVTSAASIYARPVPNRAEAGDVQYASFGARAAAAIIDMIILQTGAMLINALFIGMLLQNLTGASVFLAMVGPVVLGGAFALFYSVWLECSPWQATLGKRIMGIKVVDLAGARISFGKASWRNMAKGLSALSLGIGYLMPLWDHRNQALHDKAVGCLIVRASREPSSTRVAGLA